MTEPRRFNLRQRRALFSASDGLCEVCGVMLESGWHADHVTPWSIGGPTDVINGQALCPTCNLKKGKKTLIGYNDLRLWQKEFVEEFSQNRTENFLLVVVPGGGKTFASLYVAKRFINESHQRRYVIVIVPTCDLQAQWQLQAFKHFSLDLQTGEFDGSLKAGMDGVVITYDGMVYGSENFRRLCAKHEVMVIFDEAHHMSEAGPWGARSKEAFDPAMRRLFMSGTPWRSDGDSIPFLQRDSETGEYISHYSFDRAAALEADPQVVRFLLFHTHHGDKEFVDLIDGHNFKLSTKNEMSEEDEAKCLVNIITDKNWISSIIRKAHKKLIDIQRVKRDAAGLIVCMDQPHATFVAELLKEITGVTPHLIVSDDTLSQGATAKRFEEQRGMWIVSVRKISEGVDIPRLMVGVYLTNTVTELYFKQFTGRPSRYQGTSDDLEAHIYMPSHSKLNEYAEKIMEIQAVAIKKKNKKEEDDDATTTDTGPLPPHGHPRIVSVGEAGFYDASVIVEGIVMDSPSDWDRVSDIARDCGTTETIVAKVLACTNQLNGGSSQNDASNIDELEPLEIRLKKKRNLSQSRVGTISRMGGGEYADISIDANNYAGCTSAVSATEAQLDKRNSYLKLRIARLKNGS